jgi:hypothetical protein
MFPFNSVEQRIIDRMFTLFKTKQITMRLYETVYIVMRFRHGQRTIGSLFTEYGMLVI